MILDSLGMTSVIAGCAVMGTIMGMIVRGWSTVRNFFRNMFSYFITTIHLEDEATAKAVMAHLLRTTRRSKFGTRVFGGRFENIKDGKYGHIPFEFFGGKRVIFWRGLVPIIYTVSNGSGGDAAKKDSVIYWGNKPKESVQASLVFLRWTWNPDEIVKASSAAHNEVFWANTVRPNLRFFIKKVPDARQMGQGRSTAGTDISWFREGVYRLLSHNPEELGVRREGKGTATGNLYFPPHVTKMIQEVKLWRDRRAWYAERSIPWKRGWVLYGPPGTGKSAIVRAIGEDLDMPLFVYSLGQLLNEDLERSWAEMQAHVPCIALFEDFDNVFHGRENVFGKPKLVDLISSAPNPAQPDAKASESVPTGRLSFDCLLNCIDGVDKSNGVFTIITTNHIDKLDAALGQPRKREDGTVELISTRPGRIDKAIELGYMRREDKLKMAERIFFDNPEGLAKMIADTDDRQETPAQYQERCAQFALEYLWKQSEDRIKAELAAETKAEIVAVTAAEKPPKPGKKTRLKKVRRMARTLMSKFVG